MKLGIYIHIPFCRSKCDYCSFYSIPVSSLDTGTFTALEARYTDKLCYEIETRSAGSAGYSIDTIYFGGGTPSLLAPSEIARIIMHIKNMFAVDPGGLEITLECNPEDFSAERCDEYRYAGVNRIVLGVQTLNEKLHNTIGRSARICTDSMLDDFFSIPDIVHCIDVITGIPGQTWPELRAEIKKLTGYRPEHISAYILSIEKGTPLSGRLKNSDTLGDLQKCLFRDMIRLIEEEGYRHYEVSNFALPSFESRHNMKYWKYMQYAGFGAAAHSFYGNSRFYNNQTVWEYINDPNIRTIRDERGKNSEIAEYILTGLRLREGISLSDFEQKLGFPMPDNVFEEFKKLSREGLIVENISGNDISFRFTLEGLFVLDSLIFRLVEPYL